MACYKKAADFGDVMALNNIGLMLEQGYEDIAPQAEEALKMYKQAHNLGSLDATLNLAIFYLSGKLVPIDQKVGKALLLKAHSQKSARAGEIMLQFGIIKSKTEIEGIVGSEDNSVDSILQSVGLIGAKRSGIDGGVSQHPSA